MTPKKFWILNSLQAVTEISRKNTVKMAAMGLLFLPLLSPTVQAADVVWSNPVTISGDTDVQTNGTIAFALDYSGVTATVNGITFSNSTGGYGVTITDYLGNASAVAATVFASTSAPFSSLSSNYQSILKGADYIVAANRAGILTLSGLTIGSSYEVVFWINDSRTAGNGRTEKLWGGTASSQSIDYNNSESNGGVGQYVIGNWKADSTTQIFNMQPSLNGDTQINAIELSVVPEPSTYALLLGAGVILLFKRKGFLKANSR